MSSKSRRKKRGTSSGREPGTTPGGTAQRDTSVGRGILVRALLLLLVGGFTYAGSVSGPFIFDDQPSIVATDLEFTELRRQAKEIEFQIA